MRHRAAELATGWLGPRTELEIQRAMQREVDQDAAVALSLLLVVVAAAIVAAVYGRDQQP